MLNIYLCEDEDQQRKNFSTTIKNFLMIEELDAELVLETASPEELLIYLKAVGGVGLYFLDIDLKTAMNGLQLAQEIRRSDPRGFIVFVTSHSEMSMLTFRYKVEAMDFILKDDPQLMKSHFNECILKALERYTSTENTLQKTFTIPLNDKKIIIDYQDILYFETSTNIHKLDLHTLTKKIQFSGKLKDIEVMLDKRFYRCHRSFLVNVEHVLEMDTKNKLLLMRNGANCLYSVRKAKGLKSKLNVTF